MNCIGFSFHACPKPRLQAVLKHFLIKLGRLVWAAIFVLTQSCALGAVALDQVVSKTTAGEHLNTSEHFNPTDDAFVRRFLKLSEYIPVSEIKPGMEGYGLTVFQGTKIERFGVKVIGIIRKALNGRDAILIRLSGEKLGKNNVIRGMSGSPIYLNGRLCGALSYGFDFSKEPIVGVTPVVDMLDALSFHEEERNRNSNRPVSLQKRLPYIEAPASSLMLPNVVPVAGGTLRMTPLMAPVSLSGFSPRAQAFLKDKFEDIGLAVSSGGTGALDPALLPKMGPQSHSGEVDADDDFPIHGQAKVSPGSSVAVMLTTGAFSSAATGTTTATFGNKVVAFGHAFMEGGAVSLPMATAYILEILPSLSVSFKLSSPMQIIGSIFADRPWSVGAEVGRFATMVPVNISVTDEGRGVKKVYHCKVVNHPQLTPDLITASIMSSLDSTYQSQIPYVVKVESDIDIKDHTSIKRVDRFPVNFSAHTSSADLLTRLRFAGDPVSGYVGGIVDRLISNDFERAHVNSVTVNVTIEDGRRVTKIDRISLDKSVVAPGDEVKVNCLMKPYNGKPYNKQIAFHIPRDVPDCDLAIAACGGDELETVRKRMGISEPSPETLNQIIKKIERKERGDSLCAVLALPQQSIALEGQIIKSPPAQWTKLFFTDRSTRTPSLVRSEEGYRELGDNIIDGSHIIAVTVKRVDKVMSKPVPFSVSASTSHPSDGLFITEQAKKALESSHKSESTTTATAATTTTETTSATAAATASKIPAMWSVASAFPHMRGIQLWRQDAEENFRGAKLDGVQVDSWGRLSPGFRELARVYPDLAEDQRIWAGVYLKGNFYYSIGNKIYRWSGTSGSDAPQLVATAEGLIIPALAADPARSILYFASAPGDQVFALNLAGGPVKAVAKLEEGTITCLAVSRAGTLYMGTGGTGRLYQMHAGSPKADLVFDSGQAHVSSLWYCQRENRLYVGTAEKGCVYSVSCSANRDAASSTNTANSAASANSVKAEYESSEHIVTGVAKDNAGNLYVATAGAGKLLRIEPNGQAEPIALSDAFYSLYYDDKEDRVYAGDGEGDVTRAEIEPLNDQVHFLPVCHTEQEAVLALACDGQGKLFCGTANVAQLRSFEIAPSAEPTMCSLVHDAQRRAEWSRLRLGNLYSADKVSFDRFIKVETRGGDTSQPDVSWTPWVVAEPDNDGFVVKTQPTRYLQYKLTWKLAAAHKEAIKKRDLLVSRVDVTYLPNNFAPSFSTVSVKAGDALAGKVALSVTGSDPDADNLLLTIALSGDGGKTWKTVAADVRSRAADKDKDKDKDKTKGKDTEKVKEKEKEKDAAAKPGTGVKGSEAGKDKEKDSGKDPGKDPSKDPGEDSGKATPPDSEGNKQSGDSSAERKSKSKSKSKLEGPAGSQSGAESKSDDDDASKKGADKDSDKDKDKDKEKEKNVTKGKTKDEAADAAKTAESYSLSEKITYSLDSKKQKDGQYIMRFILSDKPSNAVGAETATVFRAITVDNDEPQIDSLVVKKLGNGNASLRLTAHDSVSDISDCLYKIDDGEGFALSAAGVPLSDSTHGVFVADSVQFEGHAKKLTVQVFDRAGNSAKKTVNLP
jgi:hypothetical protein